MAYVFKKYHLQIEHALKKGIEQLGDSSRLRDACSYACLNGGKRLRPMLVLMIGEALSNRNLMKAALSVEYFHAASLIADDLPCMDNDDMRRNKPSLHLVFEESVAILASYTLIAAGYGGISEQAKQLKEKEPQKAPEIDAAALVCLEAISRCAGLKGATQGQYMDLFSTEHSYSTFREMIEKKTATLFEISFLLGWLFGGGSKESLNDVRACALHLGVAFQIADDLQDVVQDKKENRNANLAHLLGIQKSYQLFSDEIESFVLLLKKLRLWTDPFAKFCDRLRSSVEEFVIHHAS